MNQVIFVLTERQRIDPMTELPNQTKQGSCYTSIRLHRTASKRLSIILCNRTHNYHNQRQTVLPYVFNAFLTERKTQLFHKTLKKNSLISGLELIFLAAKKLVKKKEKKSRNGQSPNNPAQIKQPPPPKKNTFMFSIKVKGSKSIIYSSPDS